MAATMQIHEMSKTYQYRKVMKPMLERKRRARINKCLDELKDLMVATLESEGEHVTRLEKADILELTVQHLQKLRQKRKLGLDNFQTNSTLSQAEGFRSGFIYAANEISRNLANLPGINVTFGTKLMTHLGQRLNQLQSPTITSSSSLSSPSSSLTSLTSPTTTATSIISNNIKIPIPIHHPITINCGGQTNLSTTIMSSSPSLSPSTSSIKTTSYGTYSVQLSPVSNYSQSPKHHANYDLMIKSENITSNGCPNKLQESDENVWRPW